MLLYSALSGFQIQPQNGPPIAKWILDARLRHRQTVERMSRILAAEVASTKVDKTDHGIVQAMRQQFDHVDDEGPGGCETGAYFQAYVDADTRAMRSFKKRHRHRGSCQSRIVRVLIEHQQKGFRRRLIKNCPSSGERADYSNSLANRSPARRRRCRALFHAGSRGLESETLKWNACRLLSYPGMLCPVSLKTNTHVAAFSLIHHL